MLTAVVNTGYEDFQSEIITMVDGVPVTSFSQFVEMIDGASGQYLELTTNLGKIIVLDREEAIEFNEEIINRYNIPGDRVVFWQIISRSSADSSFQSGLDFGRSPENTPDRNRLYRFQREFYVDVIAQG